MVLKKINSLMVRRMIGKVTNKMGLNEQGVTE
jgi:hypothetical protein